MSRISACLTSLGVLAVSLFAPMGGGALAAAVATPLLANQFSVGNFTSMAVQGQQLWLTGDGSNTVEEVNGTTGVVERIVNVGNSPDAITATSKYVWVVNNGDGTVSEIASNSGKVVNTVTVGSNPVAITSDATYVWVVNQSDNTVSQINASTAQIVNTISVGSQPSVITDDGTSVFVGNGDNSITQLSATDGSYLNSIETPALNCVFGSSYSLASDGVNLWATNVPCGALFQISISDDLITNTLPLPGMYGQTTLTSGNGYTWLGLNLEDGGVERVFASPSSISLNVNSNIGFIQSLVTSGPIVWGLGYGYLYEIVQPAVPNAPTISNVPASPVFGGSFTPVVATNGDGKTSISSLTVDVCSVSGGMVSFNAQGRCTLEAHLAAGTFFTSADGSPQTFTVGPATPTQPEISNLPSNGYVGSSFNPVISTTGDGTQSISSQTPAICTYASGVVSLVSAGICTLEAQVAAGTNYLGGVGAPQSFDVLPPLATAPTISNSPRFGIQGQTFQPQVVTNGDGVVQVTSTTPKTCQVSSPGNTVKFLTPGVCSLLPQVGSGITFSGQTGAAVNINVVQPTSLSKITAQVLSPSWSQRRVQAVVLIAGAGYTSLVVHYGAGGTRSLSFSAAYSAKDPAVANIVISTLAPSTKYSVQVTVIGPAGSAQSNVVTFTTPAIPVRPYVVASTCKSTENIQNTYYGYYYFWKYFYKYKLSNGKSTTSPVYESIGIVDPCK